MLPKFFSANARAFRDFETPPRHQQLKLPLDFQEGTKLAVGYVFFTTGGLQRPARKHNIGILCRTNIHEIGANENNDLRVGTARDQDVSRADEASRAFTILPRRCNRSRSPERNRRAGRFTIFPWCRKRSRSPERSRRAGRFTIFRWCQKRSRSPERSRRAGELSLFPWRHDPGGSTRFAFQKIR